MKRHNLQPSFRESSDSLRQQAASTNLPMPSTTASGNGVYALALGDIGRFEVYGGAVGWWCLGEGRLTFRHRGAPRGASLDSSLPLASSFGPANEL